MSKDPLVYIVLCVYNGEKYFLEQLMSLYYQNYTNWYLIIVNDGSSDNSENIARDFISHYNLHDKVMVINKENGGLNSAITVGLKEIKKITDVSNSDSFVCYCDADDIWTRDKLDIQVNYMLDHPEYGLTYCDRNNFSDNGVLIDYSFIHNNVYNKDNSFLFLSCYGSSIIATTMMFRIKNVDLILPLPLGELMRADYWTVLVLTINGIKLGYIDKPLVYYRRGHSSLISNLEKQGKEKWNKAHIRYLTEMRNRFECNELEYSISYVNNRLFIRKQKKYNTIIVYLIMLFKYTKLFKIGIDLFLYNLLKKIRLR